MFLTAPLTVVVAVLSATLLFVLLAPRTRAGLTALRVVCLWGSLLALAIGLSMGLTFDKAAAGYQYMSSIGFVSAYNSAFALGVDGLSYVFLVLTLFTFPFLFLAAWNVNKFPNHFLAHLLAMEILLVLTFITIDLFYFFVLFESLLIPMFILIGGWGARTRKIKAAYYFFLYTLFGSLFMLFGMIYLYQLTGSLNYYVLLSEAIDSKTQKLLWLCFFMAFAVKMPLFPFHIWLPEAHVEAPTVGSMLLASLLLKLGGYGLLRFSLTFLGAASVFFSAAVATLSIAGVIYGSLSTMRQIDLKRIIAYSSVAHMNLVALGIFSFNRVGIDGSIYLMVAHGVVSAALFFCVGVVYDRTHTRLLRYYGGLVTVMPLFTSLFFIFNLANMGFPGTPNFIGELLLLAGVYKKAPTISFFASAGIIFSAAYSTALHARACFGTLKTTYIQNFADTTRREGVVLGGLLTAALLLGLRTDFVLSYLEVSVWSIAHYSESAQFAAVITPTFLKTTNGCAAAAPFHCNHKEVSPHPPTRGGLSWSWNFGLTACLFFVFQITAWIFLASHGALDADHIAVGAPAIGVWADFRSRYYKQAGGSTFIARLCGLVFLSATAGFIIGRISAKASRVSDVAPAATQTTSASITASSSSGPCQLALEVKRAPDSTSAGSLVTTRRRQLPWNLDYHTTPKAGIPASVPKPPWPRNPADFFEEIGVTTEFPPRINSQQEVATQPWKYVSAPRQQEIGQWCGAARASRAAFPEYGWLDDLYADNIALSASYPSPAARKVRLQLEYAYTYNEENIRSYASGMPLSVARPPFSDMAAYDISPLPVSVGPQRQVRFDPENAVSGGIEVPQVAQNDPATPEQHVLRVDPPQSIVASLRPPRLTAPYSPSDLDYMLVVESARTLYALVILTSFVTVLILFAFCLVGFVCAPQRFRAWLLTVLAVATTTIRLDCNAQLPISVYLLPLSMRDPIWAFFSDFCTAALNRRSAKK